MVFGRPFTCPAPPVNGAEYFHAIAPLTDTRQTFPVTVSCPVLSLPVSVQVGCLPQVRRSFPLYLFTPASICLLAERHPRFHYCLGGGPSPRTIEDTLASPAFPKGSPCCCPLHFLTGALSSGRLSDGLLFSRICLVTEPLPRFPLSTDWSSKTKSVPRAAGSCQGSISPGRWTPANLPLYILAVPSGRNLLPQAGL